MALEHDNSMMENLYWWGVPTLFRCPQDKVLGSDISLVGVPHSTGNGTTERDQHLGPRCWSLSVVPFPVECGTPTNEMSLPKTFS